MEVSSGGVVPAGRIPLPPDLAFEVRDGLDDIWPVERLGHAQAITLPELDDVLVLARFHSAALRLPPLYDYVSAKTTAARAR
jgi:hypothetical protein